MRAKFLFILALSLAHLGAGAERMPTDSLDNEFRGVWLATVAGLDWPDCNKSAIVQELQLIELIKGLHKAGCNTLIFQVVSNMDAIYPSELLPWSAVMTGQEGKDPGYDPLDLAIKAAHNCGMDVHAWINPLRVSRSDDLQHDSLHVSISHPDWVQNYKHKLYLDPGNPEVISFLSDIAGEILSNYDVDGLHIDDYFYPYGLQNDPESAEWDNRFYKGKDDRKSLDEWRYRTIDNVVETLYNTTHDIKPGAVFGVSPAGRLVNTRHLYADPKRWAKAGTVDYFAPQIYWSVDRTDAAAFGKVLNSWKGFTGDIPVYVGIAAYKHNEAYYRGQDLPYQNMSEFSRELDLCRQAPYVKGHIWFRAQDIVKDEFTAYILSDLY